MGEQYSEELERLEKLELFRQETLELFNHLAKQHGRQMILNYIEQVGGIVPLVVEGWLFSNRTTNMGLQKKIYKLLKDFQPEDATRIPRPVRPPLLKSKDKE